MTSAHKRPIRILDPRVADKIAAGEVVERPASVVKELAENAIDAGATHVTVEVRGGGVELIRVTDDGEGIPVLDLEVALERHATSKVSQDSDLESISTLGFRGEALPSIAAVSRLVLTSRARGTDQGAYVRVNGGVLERKGAAGVPEGTSVEVRDLFANVPARRKFLRSEAAEATRIHVVVTQLAMAYPEIRFDLVVGDRARFGSPGSGSLRDVLGRLYDRDTVDGMLEVSGEDDGGHRAWGFVSSPSVHRANRSAINFYVNRRWVQSRLLLQAVDEAYRGLLMEGRHPIIAIHVELPPEELDVNVHPAKREVRFHSEGAVFSLVQRATRQALVAQSPVPLVIPEQRRGEVSPVQTGPISRWGVGREQGEAPLPWRLLIPERTQQAPQDEAGQPLEERPLPLMTEALPALRVLGQAGGMYIVAEGPEGVYLIDQHAAHERVLYERVARQAAERAPEVQGLLEPLAVEIQPTQIQAVEAWKDTLTGYGFHGEPFGDNVYLLRGVPGGLKDTGPEGLLDEVLDLLSNARDPAQAADVVAASIACHSAVRAGDPLNQEEMASLVRQLEAAESPHTCPHGRPTMVHMSAANLEREFGRR
jgi:DNA mismatch repair protein MutL